MGMHVMRREEYEGNAMEMDNGGGDTCLREDGWKE